MKLSSAKKRITSDWNALFPEMGVYKPLHLMRRFGPLLQGVLLERDSSNEAYRPVSHVHCLLRPSDAVRLSLAVDLPAVRTGAPESIPVRLHDAKYRDAAARLQSATPLPMNGNPTLDEVIGAYRALRRPEDGLGQFEEAGLLLAWAGRLEAAVRYIAECVSVAAAWPPQWTVGDLAAWETETIERLNVGDFEARIAEAVRTLGVDKLPEHELSVDFARPQG